MTPPKGGRGAPVAPVPRSATVYDVFYVDIMLIISYFNYYISIGWLGSRVVSKLDSEAERSWVQIAAATLSGNSFRQTVHTHCASVHQAAKLVAALLRVCEGNCRLGGK